MTQYNIRPRFVVPPPPPNAIPVAHFTVNTALLIGTFSDDSTDLEGPIASWAWTFGDAGSGVNNTSTLQNPSHTFSANGTYTVTLTVKDQASQSSVPFSRTVTVAGAGNQLPNASFTFSKTLLVLSVHDTSTDPDGTIASRDWNWGDATAHSTAANPSHTYASQGTYTVVLTVTDNSGGTDTDTQLITVSNSTAKRTDGLPFGPIGNGWQNNTVPQTYTDLHNTIEQGVGDAAGLRARITASTTLEIQNILALTGGGHRTYFTDFGDGITINPRFDRILWNQKLEGGGALGAGFADSATKLAIANAAGKEVLGCDVMDEPNVDGGADGNGNTWGPTGTMTKVSFNSYSRWHVVVSSDASASSGPTTINCQPIQGCANIPSGTKLIFLPRRNGITNYCVLSAQAAVGATSISVTSLARILKAGDVSNSNAIDNMAAHMKHVFPTVAVGVTHRHNTFWPDESYAVIDFLIDQYSFSKGAILPWREAALALGARDGHQIAFSLNVINGGPTISGCPVGNTLTGSTGGSDGGGHCNMNNVQILTWGRILYATNSLSQRGISLLLWTYNATYFSRNTKNDIRDAFSTLRDELALLTPLSWYRS